MADNINGDSLAAPAQLSAVEAKLKGKYGDDVPSAVRNAIGEAVRLLETAMEGTPSPTTGSPAPPAQNNNVNGLPLPPELRNSIYDLCIGPVEQEVGIHWRHPMSFSPLTQVCRQMRQDTLSYYWEILVLNICACMRRPERMQSFLLGPGQTLIPWVQKIDIRSANSGLDIELPRSNQSVEKLRVYAEGGRNCDREQTDEEDETRRASIWEFESKVGFFLEDRMERQENGDHSIPVGVFKEVCEWDEEHFSD